MATCLTPKDFEQYDRGTLCAAAREEVRTHVDSCDACRNRYEQFRQGQDSPGDARLLTADRTESLIPVTATGTSLAARVARHFPRIESYQITGVLGQGGMGIVYRAVQTKLNRTVALKVLPAIVGIASPGAVSRFRREATGAGSGLHLRRRGTVRARAVFEAGPSRSTRAADAPDGQSGHQYRGPIQRS